MRIIIIDDQPTIRSTLRMALEAMGHGVEEASSGAEALRAVEERPCEVALLDLRLGDESASTCWNPCWPGLLGLRWS